MTPQNETPQQFTARASFLLTNALRVTGSREGDYTRFNALMTEAKAKRMTWVEGLQYIIDQS